MPLLRPLSGALRCCAVASLAALSLAASAQSPAPLADPAIAPMPGATTWVQRSLIEPALPFDEPLLAALAGRDHADARERMRALAATDLRGDQLRDLRFVQSWVAIRAGDRDAAVGLLEEVRGAEHVPEPYRLLTEAELMLTAGDAAGAARVAAQVDPTSGVASRATLLRARALEEAGQTAAALALYRELAERPDPSPGSALALWTLARKAGTGSPAAYTLLRRLWSAYPTTSEGRQAGRLLAAEYEPRGREFQPRDADIATRMDQLMGAWRFEEATKMLADRESRFVTPDANACMAWYAYGRSHFKRNNITKAAAVLGQSGRKCVGIDEDRGAKSLYIAGKALERKKAWADAARHFQLIPELYPAHSMADDGYALAGIAWQIAGEPERALELWTRQVDEYPTGDLAAEGFWRLAWISWLDGDTDAAIRHAERMIWQVPFESDPVHVMAASYWAARWRIQPDRADPAARHPDPARVALGIDQLAQLCRDHPTRFYSLLAAARLYEVAPERVSGLQRPAPSGVEGLEVRADWLNQPAVQRALALTRLGLVGEAMVELDSAQLGEPLPGEEALTAWIIEQRNPFEAHDRLHKYLLGRPASTLGRDRDTILQTAYPDHYWDLVQEATDGYGYDGRIFHALVREESSFNVQIVSWAGAKGLSQLMPATAKQVAGWLGISVNRTTIFDPLTNLRIGSRYLEYLRGLFDDNMVLAVPAYNAGEGNVGKWLKATDNPPTDEFVESIPIRETRHYVKRVLGTYQLYHSLYGDGPLYPDWSARNHSAVP